MVLQFAGGVPAMCDGITQGNAGMELSLFLVKPLRWGLRLHFPITCSMPHCVSGYVIRLFRLADWCFAVWLSTNHLYLRGQ
jgi:hypothetical protein